MSNIRSMYTIVENPLVDYNAIRLTEATPWSGFIFSFDKVQMCEENPDGTATLRFTYIPETVSIKLDEATLKSPEFNKLLGDILVDLLEEGFAKGKESIEDVGQEDSLFS